MMKAFNNKVLNSKIFSILTITIILLFTIENDVFATSIGGNGEAKDYGSSGDGGYSCSDSSQGNYNGTSGLRISVLDSSGKRLVAPVDFYASSTEFGNIPKKSYSLKGTFCSKIEYMKGTCESKTKPTILPAGFSNFLSDSESSKKAVKKIFDYLERNNYYNLKELVKKTKYNCIDNVSGKGNCTIEKMNKTYIVVEPMAMFDMNFATAYEMGKIGADCWLKNKWGRLASFTSPNGKYFEKELKDEVAGSKFYNAIKSKSSTNAITIYSLSDIGVVPALPKKGTLEIEVRKYVSSKETPLITSVSTSIKVGNITYKTGNSGKIKITDLDAGNYNFSITAHPTNYSYRSSSVTPSGNGTVSQNTTTTVKIESNKTTKIVIYYDPTCNSDLAEKSHTKDNLSMIYKTWKSKGQDLKGLLNFDDPSCTKVDCNYSSNSSCLSGNFGSTTFNQNNVSCYNEMIDVNNSTLYCLTSFNLVNKLGISSFSAKSGQMPISFDILDKAVAATGTVSKKCLVIGNATPTDANIGKYSDYVTNVKFDNQILISKSDNDLEQTKKDNNWYEYSLSVNYYLKDVYATNGKGEILYGNGDTSSKPCTNCKFLGYGIIGKFSDKGEIDIPFSISFNNIKVKNLKYEDKNYKDKCKVNLIPELVPVCDPKKEKCDNPPGNHPDDPMTGPLNLEFRLIDTSNPFPGKSGNGRKVGSNWCEPNQYSYTIADALNALQIANGSITPTSTELDKYDLNRDGIIDLEEALNIQSIATSEISMLCTNDNSTIQEYIKNAPNSYGRVPNTNATATPIYKIELTPDTIKSIRDYNKDKETTYDDYTLKCDNDGVNCKSTFLEKFGIKRLS